MKYEVWWSGLNLWQQPQCTNLRASTSVVRNPYKSLVTFFPFPSQNHTAVHGLGLSVLHVYLWGKVSILWTMGPSDVLSFFLVIRIPSGTSTPSTNHDIWSKLYWEVNELFESGEQSLEKQSSNHLKTQPLSRLACHLGCIRSKGTGILIQCRFCSFWKSQYILSPNIHSLRLKVLEDWGNMEGCKLSYFLNVESSYPCMQNHIHEDWEVLGIGDGPSVDHHLTKEIRQFQVHGVNQASPSPCSCQCVYLSSGFNVPNLWSLYAVPSLLSCG